jgi:FemAB-related protein (PEP-CTERM system-associated)
MFTDSAIEVAAGVDESRLETVLTDLSGIGDAWDEFVRSHPHGSPFHLTAWHRTIQDVFGYKPRHVVTRDNHGKIQAILPQFLVRSLIFGRVLLSTPLGVYGGVLATSDEAARATLHRAYQLAEEDSVQFLELRNCDNLVADDRLCSKDLYVTFRQPLGEDVDAALTAIPRKTRAEVREGIKKGLEFRVDAISVEDFFDVYSRSVRNLGTPVFSRNLFVRGREEFGSDCKIFSIHWQGKLVGAVWTLFYKDQVLPYYGASVREYNHLAVNSFMYWMLIKYGIEHGYRVFDFGRSKKGTGSFDFKKRWGMVMTELPYQYYLVRKTSLPDTSPLNPKFALAIKVWRSMPLAFTNCVGPFIAKQLI